MRARMNAAVQLKKGEFVKNIKRLIIFMRPYYLPIVISLVFTAASAVISIFAPQVLSDLVNVITASFGGSPIDMGELGRFAVILIVFYVCNALCTYVSGFIMTTVSQKMSKSLRTEISEKINRVPLKYFDAHPYGDTLSRVTNDVDTIGNSMQQAVTMVVQSAFLLTGVLIAMFVTSWQLALTVLIIVPFMAVLLLVIMKFSQPQFRRQQDELAVLNGKVEENYSGQLVIKAFNAEGRTGEDFEASNARLKKATFLSQALSGIMQPAMTFISYFAYAAVCVVAGIMISDPLSGVTFGTLSAFLVYVNLFQSPLSQIAQAANVLQSAAAASGRVFEFLEEEELSDETGKQYKLTGQVRGEVEFRHVRFGYDDSRVIIPDFSAKVQPGWKVAIVGPTGAGKTTMVNLLMRFYEVNSGDILIDGVSVKDMPRAEVHDLFGMVLQDTWMFEGTLRENIVYSKDATDEELKKACDAAGITHYIATQPGGLDHYVENGDEISGGQKQLITIARAMIENAPMLILDEATSNVDTRTEEIIQTAMDNLTRGRTSFVIAHRLSTIKNADLILVMNDGNIIEQGTHDELIAGDGFYAKLYNSQFAGE
ncbi:MAG TPA: ABC transporter ATP-binding protein [Candidatus Coproplasma avistercoris]|nr:ABC transporter ATP-binding protein [Candidatus Coproplasma avistercoris]